MNFQNNKPPKKKITIEKIILFIIGIFSFCILGFFSCCFTFGMTQGFFEEEHISKYHYEENFNFNNVNTLDNLNKEIKSM